MKQRTKRIIRLKDPSHAPMDELRQARVDLGALANALHARANAIKEAADGLTDEINRREGNLFDITDHAVLQYLARVVGYDIEGVRSELKRKIEAAIPIGPLKSEAEAYLHDGLLFVVCRRRLVVTVYPEGEAEKIEPALADGAFH